MIYIYDIVYTLKLNIYIYINVYRKCLLRPGLPGPRLDHPYARSMRDPWLGWCPWVAWVAHDRRLYIFGQPSRARAAGIVGSSEWGRRRSVEPRGGTKGRREGGTTGLGMRSEHLIHCRRSYKWSSRESMDSELDG